MIPVYDEFGVVHYALLPTIDQTAKGLERACKRIKRLLIRPRTTRGVK